MYSCLDEKKKAIVKIKNVINTAKLYIVFNFTEFTANEINTIRQDLRELDSTILVLKNTIFKIYAKEMLICEETVKKFQGQLFVIASKKNEQLISKKLNTELFNKKTIFIHAALDGKTITSEDLNTLATTPDKNVILNRLMFAMNNAIYTFAETTKKPVEKFLQLLSVYNKKNKNTT
jgi:ribosomal protein L10